MYIHSKQKIKIATFYITVTEVKCFVWHFWYKQIETQNYIMENFSDIIDLYLWYMPSIK
jgi:hypothetical protein